MWSNGGRSYKASLSVPANVLLMGFPERPASATALFENILSLLSFL